MHVFKGFFFCHILKDVWGKNTFNKCAIATSVSGPFRLINEPWFAKSWFLWRYSCPFYFGGTSQSTQSAPLTLRCTLYPQSWGRPCWLAKRQKSEVWDHRCFRLEFITSNRADGQSVNSVLLFGITASVCKPTIQPRPCGASECRAERRPFKWDDYPQNVIHSARVAPSSETLVLPSNNHCLPWIDRLWVDILSLSNVLL